jgi:acyl carrier protein
MVPSVFVFRSELPHTPNGKVDRKALLSLALENSDQQQKAPVTPHTATERQLTAICAEVLHLDRVGIHDSLFDLGADSVHLFQIIARAARVNLTITPGQLLRLRNIAALAAEIDRRSTESKQPSLPQITPVSRDAYRLDPVTRQA